MHNGKHKNIPHLIPYDGCCWTSASSCQKRVFNLFQAPLSYEYQQLQLNSFLQFNLISTRLENPCSQKHVLDMQTSIEIALLLWFRHSETEMLGNDVQKLA